MNNWFPYPPPQDSKKFMHFLTLFFDSALKYICDALSNLVPFAQFKKREKHSWGSVTCSTGVGTKSITPPWVLFRFLKSYKWY